MAISWLFPGDHETYLEGPADTEDAVVGLLGGETLDGSLNGVVLLGDQVIGSVSVSHGVWKWEGRIGPARSQTRTLAQCQYRIMECNCPVSPALSGVSGMGRLLQTQFPVAGSVGVPLGQRHHPILEPWALDDVVGKRRSRHGEREGQGRQRGGQAAARAESSSGCSRNCAPRSQPGADWLPGSPPCRGPHVTDRPAELALHSGWTCSVPVSCVSGLRPLFLVLLYSSSPRSSQSPCALSSSCCLWVWRSSTVDLCLLLRSCWYRSPLGQQP
jgi:hypothetical protein